MKKTGKLSVSNVSHRPPAYFEWFYFHFVTDDGVAINMVLHETDIFGLKQKPYLSLSVLIPGLEPIYLRTDLDGAMVVADRIRENAAALPDTYGVVDDTTVSIGVVCTQTAPRLEFGALIQQVTRALRDAKRRGGDTVVEG